MTGERGALLAGILTDPTRAQELGTTEAIILIAEVAVIQATLATRIATQSEQVRYPPSAAARVEEDRLLTVDEAASRLGVTRQWLYRHSKELPFTRKLSRKALRFSESGMQRWQEARTP